MNKYRKKPIVIEAVRYEGTVQEIVDFAGIHETKMDEQDKLYIKTLEGDMLVSHGDYVIKGIQGEFYPCKPDIFEATYERLNESVEERRRVLGIRSPSKAFWSVDLSARGSE